MRCPPIWRFHPIASRILALTAPRDPGELGLARGRILHLAPARSNQGGRLFFLVACETITSFRFFIAMPESWQLDKVRIEAPKLVLGDRPNCASASCGERKSQAGAIIRICFAIAAPVLAGVSGIALSSSAVTTAEAGSPVATIQFADNSDAMDAAAAKILDQFAERHRTGKSRIVVTAYADRNEGAEYGPEYGRGLSHRRASDIRSYLFPRGIDVGRTEIQAFGTDKPKGTLSSANRRAEIHIIA